MLKSEWLSHCTLSAIGAQWLELVYEIVMFYRRGFAKVLEENVDENG